LEKEGELEILGQGAAEVLADNCVVKDVDAAVGIHVHTSSGGSVTGEQRGVIEDVYHVVAGTGATGVADQ